MKSLYSKLEKLVFDEDGATATEYAVMLALIIIVCIAAIAVLGTKVNDLFQSAVDEDW